jgi:hypothetical protein
VCSKGTVVFNVVSDAVNLVTLLLENCVSGTWGTVVLIVSGTIGTVVVCGVSDTVIPVVTLRCVTLLPVKCVSVTGNTVVFIVFGTIDTVVGWNVLEVVSSNVTGNTVG